MGILSLLLNVVYMILGVEPVQKFPKALSKEEEAECFQRCKNGDMSARNKLIEHNLRLVAHIVRKYYVSYNNQEDLISVGTIGLIKAIDSFNASNGARFATYAAKCIQNEILMLFRSQKKLGYEVSLNDTIDIDKDGNPLTYIDIVCTEDTIAEDLDKKIKINKALEYIKNKYGKEAAFETLVTFPQLLSVWKKETVRDNEKYKIDKAKSEIILSEVASVFPEI